MRWCAVKFDLFIFVVVFLSISYHFNPVIPGLSCHRSTGVLLLSPSETYGRKWGDSNFQILTELPVTPQAAGTF